MTTYPDDEIADIPDRFLALRDEAFARFAEGYAEYGDGAADEMGLAAQWLDLNRKVKKLKREMWNGEDGTLTRESTEEILQDIIGHALLALDMRQRGFKGGPK
jgi:hypothetical protein